MPEDDHDSSSEISGADSLQVIASHARTYSVPSTDDEWDDDDCVALERGQAKDSPTATPWLPPSFLASSSTIPNRSEANLSDSPEVNEKSENAPVGASQANPIDIDQAQQQSIDLDSDDDGPEILPIDATPTALMTHGKSAGLSQPSAHTPDSQPSSAPRRLSRDFGFDDSWLPQQRYDRDLTENAFFPDPDDVHETHIRPFVVDTYNVGFSHRNQNHGPRPHVSFELPSGHPVKPIKNPFEDSSNPHLSSDNGSPNAINVDRLKATTSTTAAPRPPSPSDAALAKKSSAPLSSGEVLHEQITTDRSGDLRANDALSGPKISSRPYDVGPFSYAKQAAHLETSLAPRGSEEDYSNHYCGFFDPVPTPQYSQSRPYSSLHTLFPRDNWERPHNSDSGNHSSYCKGPTGYRHVEGNPARVNIADLVNQSTSAPHDHNGLGQKRKAAEMEEPAETTDDHTMAGALPTPESEGLTLPDAQPREQSTFPLQSLTHESSVLQDTEPAVGSVQQNTPPSADTDNGPARKKVKTSPSRATGIGKFFSGIAVGVAGVVAAFIATIPASVREEALREINNAK